MLARRLAAYAPNHMSLEEHELPDQSGPGEVLVEAVSTLVSAGTEVANYAGRTVQRAAVGADWRERPYYPGYSLAGRVRTVGPGVADLAPGDRIAGSVPHASLALVPARRLVKVPDAVSFDEAAWSTLIAIVLNAVRLGTVQLGESVAVVGVGPIGQLAVQLARLDGGRPVVALDLIPARLRVAAACGAHATIELGASPAGAAAKGAPPAASPSTPLPEPAAALTGGRGFDVVFEATGSPAGLPVALSLAARGGRVVLLGSTRGLVESFDAYGDVHLKGVTLIGAHASTAPEEPTFRARWTERANRQLGLDLVADGALQVGRLISHRITPDAAPETFRRLSQERAAFLGVVLDWRGESSASGVERGGRA